MNPHPSVLTSCHHLRLLVYLLIQNVQYYGILSVKVGGDGIGKALCRYAANILVAPVLVYLIWKMYSRCSVFELNILETSSKVNDIGFAVGLPWIAAEQISYADWYWILQDCWMFLAMLTSCDLRVSSEDLVMMSCTKDRLRSLGLVFSQWKQSSILTTMRMAIRPRMTKALTFHLNTQGYLTFSDVGNSDLSSQLT